LIISVAAFTFESGIEVGVTKKNRTLLSADSIRAATSLLLLLFFCKIVTLLEGFYFKEMFFVLPPSWIRNRASLCWFVIESIIAAPSATTTMMTRCTDEVTAPFFFFLPSFPLSLSLRSFKRPSSGAGSPSAPEERAREHAPAAVFLISALGGDENPPTLRTKGDHLMEHCPATSKGIYP